MTTTTGDWAASYAEELLSPLGDRWRHVHGVARQAQRVAPVLPADERDELVAAAYLHDLGYAPSLVQTDLHALDGARHLRALGHERLAGLVAYHSGARAEAELRGLAAELADFEDEASATSMALTYCDMTTGAAGEPVTLAERLADVERRYGVGHVVTRSVYQAQPEVERCIQVVESRLRRMATS
jgi:HD superfamily phosphodiesterase